MPSDEAQTSAIESPRNSREASMLASAIPPTITPAVIEPNKTELTGPGPANGHPTQFPTGLKLVTILLCVYATVFLVALDRMIIATAVPKITDQFHSIDDIGWYASAFLLPACAFMLVFGKLYQMYPVKTVYLSCVTLFEIGSAICGAAPTSNALIVGRAVAGLGSAGLFSGTIVIIVHTIPLAKRPIFQGLFGAIFGISSVIGPLLGGAFTDKVSWRWCFYINLPIGAVVLSGLFFFLDIQGPNLASSLTLKQQLLKLDPIGTGLFLYASSDPGIVCLLLALQWGGVEYPWSSARVLVCLILGLFLLLGFVGVQVWKGEGATIPPRVITQKSIAAAVWYSFFSGAAMLTIVYYVPIWFQAVLAVSAVGSGIRTLALVLALVVGSILGGAITGRTGYYTPPLIAGCVIMSVGAGLLTTWSVHTQRAEWIGYQVLFGFGLGLGMQQSNLAIQTVLPRKDVSTGTALVFFGQSFGGTVFVSVGQNIFASKLTDYLQGIEGVNVPMVVNSGATGLRHFVQPELLPLVLDAFSRALVKTFYVAVAASCMGFLGSLTMEWRSIKNGEGQGAKEVQKDSGTEKV